VEPTTRLERVVLVPPPQDRRLVPPRVLGVSLDYS
jgi:hypothetical protein